MQQVGAKPTEGRQEDVKLSCVAELTCCVRTTGTPLPSIPPGKQKTKLPRALCTWFSKTVQGNAPRQWEDTRWEAGMAAGWPCMQILSFSKVKSQAYKNIGSRHRKMHSAVFNHFTGGIDFILFPLAPDQAQLLTGIFHYPVANTPGQSGHLTNSHPDPPPQQQRGLA